MHASRSFLGVREQDIEEAVTSAIYEKPFKLTPFIVTFGDSTLTSIDIQNFIEMGMQIVRFKMTHITHGDKLRLIEMINDAVKFCCDKYDVSNWPIAISVDLPNCIIRTGLLKEEIEFDSVFLIEDSIVEITSNIFYFDKCDEEVIYVDDTYMIEAFKVGMELSIRFGEIVMFCTEIVDTNSIKCIVYRGGALESMDFVSVRGTTHTKPPLTKRDLEIIHFAKDFEIDMVTINSVRKGSTVRKVRTLLEPKRPVLMSSICEQEGLDNIDDIIKESDGIILSREFLANEILNKHQMTAIQLQTAAKCKKMGKPFYISGNIMEQTLLNGILSTTDIADATNAVMHGAGFVLRDYHDTANIVKAMAALSAICKSVEPLYAEDDFWRLYLEFPLPVNAAEAAVLGCALSARIIGTNVVIIPTVTGHTVTEFVRIAPMAIVLSICTKSKIAKRLQIYRGVIAIIYEKTSMNNWYLEMEARIRFAVEYGIKHNILKYGQMYVTIQRSSLNSAYCDMVGFQRVESKEMNRLKAITQHIPISSSDALFKRANV